jgi:hypothetical protein
VILKKQKMKKLFLSVVMMVAVATVSYAQAIPGLPTKTITDVAKTATDLTKGIGTAVGGLTPDQQKKTTPALTDLLNGLNKDVIPKQLTNPAAALTNFNKLKEIFNGKIGQILGAAKLAKLVGGNSNGATGAILGMLGKM